MINIICVLKQSKEYDKDYVIALYNAVSKHTSLDFQFICFTDDLDILPEYKQEIYFIRLREGYDGWWNKIQIFQLTGKNLYFDLDTVIVNNIDIFITCVYLLNEDTQFIGVKAFSPKRALNPKKCMNSGVMGWNGDFSYIFYDFDYEKVKRNQTTNMNDTEKYLGDQDVIHEKLIQRGVNVKFWQDETGGLYSYKKHCMGRPHVINEEIKDAKVICFHGHPRPREEAKKVSWIKNHWNVNNDNRIYSNTNIQEI